MSIAATAGGSRSPLEVSYEQLNPPRALSGTIPAATVDITTERFARLSPSSKRPPLLSYNSTDTVSTRASVGFPGSPIDSVCSSLPIMTGSSTTQQGFGFYEQYPITPIYELQHPPLLSGLVGFDTAALEEKSNATNILQQTYQAESEGEADSSGARGDKSFSQTFFDINQVKHRRRTTTAQLEVLDAYFQESPKPNMETRREISSKLGMTLREVQVWFQNRRAKQKKIESRAATEAERALSAPLLSPATLTPVSRRPFAYRSYNTAATTEQPIPAYNAQPNVGNMQTSLPLVTAGVYSNQQPSRDFSQPYHTTNFQAQAQIPRQNQHGAYLGNLTSNFNTLGPAFQHPQAEPAWHSSSHEARPQYNFNAGNMSGWNSNQPQPFGQNTFSQADSVSPASSRSSSQDLGQTVQRRSSTVPPALSNLSGLSMTPGDGQQSPTAVASSYFSGIPLAPATVPIDASAPASTLSGEALGLGSYQAMQPLYPGAILPATTSAISPIAPTFPMLSSTAPLFPTSMAYSSTLGLMQPYAPIASSTIDNGGQLMQQIPQYSGQAVANQNPAALVDPMPFVTNYNSIAPFENPVSNVQSNGTLVAGRRQSMFSFNNVNMTDLNANTAAPAQLQSLNESPSLPGAFGNLVDESGLPTRRSSTSAINFNSLQRQSPAFQPIAPRPSARAKPPIPVLIPSTSSNSSSSVDEGPILGGLRRGSIQSKRLKSPTSPLYQPYPQPHIRDHSTVDIMKNFESTH